MKSRIVVCPHCGHSIGDPLTNGIASCQTCTRLFDTSLHFRLLSAAWLIKAYNYHGIDQLIADTKLPEREAIFVYSFMEDHCYSVEEFREVLGHFNLLPVKQKAS